MRFCSVDGGCIVSTSVSVRVLTGGINCEIV